MIKKVFLTDAAHFTSRTITPEGYLQGVASLTCAEVIPYRLHEIWQANNRQQQVIPGDPNEKVNILRSPETIKAVETADSAKFKPITMDHPAGDVDVDNYKDVSVGTIGENVFISERGQLMANIQITDKAAIDEIQNGKAQVSCGYAMDLENVSGVFNGKPYAWRTIGSMVINHLAIVKKGRHGYNARIQDKNPTGDFDMDEKEIKAAITDGVSKAVEAATAKKPDATATPAQISAAVSDAMKPIFAAMKKETDEKEKAATDAATKDAADKASKDNADKIISDAHARADLLVGVRGLVSDEQMTEITEKKMSNTAILRMALKDHVDGAETKDEMFLRGALDTISKERKAGETYRSGVADQHDHSLNVPVANGIQQLQVRYKNGGGIDPDSNGRRIR